MRRWRAPKGTAALLRERVSGCRRSPRPPAITIPRTRGMCANNGRLRASVKGGAPRAVGRGSVAPDDGERPDTEHCVLDADDRATFERGFNLLPTLHEPAMQDDRLVRSAPEADVRGVPARVPLGEQPAAIRAP